MQNQHPGYLTMVRARIAICFRDDASEYRAVEYPVVEDDTVVFITFQDGVLRYNANEVGRVSRTVGGTDKIINAIIAAMEVGQ